MFQLALKIIEKSSFPIFRKVTLQSISGKSTKTYVHSLWYFQFPDTLRPRIHRTADAPQNPLESQLKVEIYLFIWFFFGPVDLPDPFDKQISIKY